MNILIFARPQFLYLLLIVPLLPLLYGLSRYFRKRRLRRFGDETLVRNLMPRYSRSKGWVKVILFTLAFAFFAVGLSRPQLGAKLKEHKAKGAEIMICLDVSNSMLAQDYSPDRLERAKLAISRLVDRLQGDRIGLIIFAGSSFVQLPITTDYISAKMFLGSITTESVPVQGTAIGDAISTAARSFSAQSENSRAIIVITDGENHEDDPVSVAKDVADMGVKVYTIGVGSPQGKPIPYKGEYLKDKDGNMVVTRLDEKTLQEVARAGNGAYIHAGNEEFGLNPIIDDIRRLQQEEFSNVVFEEYDEQYMYFYAIALALLVLEALIGERRSRRRLFQLVFLASVLGLSGPVASAQADRREVRAGNRDFRKENYREADIDYRRALVKDSTSFAANYNLANTLYRQESFDEAGKSLERLKEAAPASVHAADYYYNTGDVAIRMKDWGAAVEAFKQALLRRPEDLDAKENYIYAKKMLDNQQQNGGGDNNQDQNQDQNKDQDQQNQDQQNQNQQNQDQNQDQNQQEQPQPQPQDQKISPQQARQMLQAVQAKEKETQEKVNKEKAAVLKSRQKDKNW